MNVPKNFIQHKPGEIGKRNVGPPFKKIGGAWRTHQFEKSQKLKKIRWRDLRQMNIGGND